MLAGVVGEETTGSLLLAGAVAVSDCLDGEGVVICKDGCLDDGCDEALLLATDGVVVALTKRLISSL